MKSLTPFYALMGLFLVCVQLQAQSLIHLSDYGLQGTVKTLRETEYQIKENYGRQGESRRYFCTYDTIGNKIEEIYSDGSGAELQKVQYRYDSPQKLGEEKLFIQSKLFETLTYHYSGSTLKIKKSDEMRYEYLLGYHGKPIKKTEYQDNIPVAISQIQYDSQGKIIQIKELEPNGKLRYHHEFSFDDKGNKIEKREYDENNVLLFTCVYTYNAKNQIATELGSYTGSSEPIKIQYTYKNDAKGNWIEMTESMDGKSYAITLRRITYY